MSYFIRIKQDAVKALEKMPRKDRLRIVTAIDLLKDNPAAGGVLKGEFSGLRRIRIGNYRVVYEVHDQELCVLVIRIGHRRDVYR